MAVQYERRGDFEQVLRELSVALQLYPQSLDARREFAWVAATGSGAGLRKNTDAIADALVVLRLADDPDALDTLAAAYASAGMFDLAVKEERAALLDGARSSESKPGYQQRLILYQQHTVYRQSESAHEPAGVFKP
jgi:tetratricopeptide (TPR) repeat protein